MKSLMLFLRCVLIDLGTRCGTSTTLDLKTIESRVEHEGLSFLTITLAKFGKDFQKSLDQGFVASNQFLGFTRSGGLPRFLSGFLRRVFDSKSGRLLDDPCINSIYAIRQLTLMFAKMEVPCSPERVDAAFRKFVECEQDVRLADQRLLSEPDLLEDFARIGRLLWADFFSHVDSKIYQESILPRHGPGATADQLRGNAKYEQGVWPRRLEDVFPHWEHIIPSESFLEWTDSVNILEPRDEIPVKVIAVPKTLETPRLIAVEPTCMQYMQQGVLAVMKQSIPSFNQTRELVMFERQEPNQRLAHEGSIFGALATLDLSEASDRVSNQHVRILLSNHRFLREAVDATRSRKADVPGHGEIRLAKFASMGSALTFPMEAIVFMTVVFLGIEKSLGRRLTIEDVESLYGRVRAYGDDIIVPVEHVHRVVEALETFGFRVNRNKSFWTGRFRESCGKDYYAGRDVSIARVRRFLPTSRRNGDEIASAVSLRNQLFHLGFVEAVSFLDTWISGIIPFPVVESGSPLLGRHSYEPCQPERMHPDTHIPLVKGVVVWSRPPESFLEGPGALMKWFLEARNAPLEDKDHLLRSGRPRSVSIKTRWATPYSYGVVAT